MPQQSNTLFRCLPSMHVLLEAALQEPATDVAFAALPRPFLRELLEEFLTDCRAHIAAGEITDANNLSLPALLPQAVQYVENAAQPRFRRVLNGTGVVLHTNLGRSLLADAAVQAVQDAAAHYSNLEFDLSTGARGSRYSHVEELICRLTGAESALVVNNNAAAVLLVLDTLCKGGEVIVSRGELVEIGGSFRIPDVMEKSGCILREVGATNRTHLKDYASALSEHTTALMKVHTSNYRIIGFTKEVTRQELAILAKEKNLPLIEDLGSGTLIDFTKLGLPQLSGEPTAAHVLAAGVDVVTFSGDKVLGGPQAGIIAGKKHVIDKIKKNPMNRALRIDKMTLAALEATLRLYLDEEMAKSSIPTLRMITTPQSVLKDKAQKLLRQIKKHLAQLSLTTTVALRSGESQVGGGSFPECNLPTYLVTIHVAGLSVDILRQRLLHIPLPLVGRVEADAFCLDVRTLEPAEFSLVAQAITRALSEI